MAAYCFCGCGRKVRFANKRLSKRGAKSRGISRNVEGHSPTGSPENSTEEKQVQELIRRGEQVRAMYAEVVHGHIPAPDRHVQAAVFEWERDAGKVATAFARDVAARRV